MGRKESKDKYRLLTGSHMEGKVEYVAGLNDVIESDNDLCTMFPNKFEKLSKPSNVPSMEFDEDVTENYEVEEGTRVYRKGSWCYLVVDGSIQNEKGLRKEDVQEFIDSPVEDDD